MFTTDAVHRAIRRHMRRRHVKSHTLAGHLFACYLRPRGPVLAWHHAAVEALNYAGKLRRDGRYKSAGFALDAARRNRLMCEGWKARKAA